MPKAMPVIPITFAVFLDDEPADVTLNFADNTDVVSTTRWRVPTLADKMLQTRAADSREFALLAAKGWRHYRDTDCTATGGRFWQAHFLAILQLAKSSLRATIGSAKHPLPRGVMVAQQILILFDKVRVLAGQPLRRTLPRMKLLFSSLAMLLLATCASEPPPKPRPPQPLLTDLDHGKTVLLVVGETVDLHLESNPTTGYSWSSLRLPEQKVVKQTHHAYQGPESTLLVGAGGKEHWRFMAVAEGKTGLDLLYRRAWEEPQDSDQKLTIEFVVTKAEK